jgi:hypothetical protein
VWAKLINFAWRRLAGPEDSLQIDMVGC